VIAVEIFIVLSLYIYVLFRMPEFRIVGSAIALVVIAVLVFYMVTVPPAQEVELTRISLEEVEIEGVDLSMGPINATLTGRAINGSPTYTLTGIELEVRLFDCPSEEAALGDCFTIGEDAGYARLSAPPGQLRSFKATLLFSNLPEIEGVMRWEYSVNALRALDIANP